MSKVYIDRQRIGLYPPNRGVDSIAQRKIGEAAGRAAIKSANAVRVDAHLARIWMRAPRAAQQCICSGGVPSDIVTTPPTGVGGGISIELPVLEGDDLNWVDRGYPLDPDERNRNNILGNPQELLPQDELPDNTTNIDMGFDDDLTRQFLGDGRRCAICWGTGWIDGHRLWGGERIMCTGINTIAATVVDTNMHMDTMRPTPTMQGPGYVIWQVSTSEANKYLDAIRVLSGESVIYPQLLARADAPTTSSQYEAGWVPLADFLGIEGGFIHGQALEDFTGSFFVRVDIDENTRFSILDIIVRSEELQPVQLPQLQQTAAMEKIAPFIQSDFEVLPQLGSPERGSLIEVLGRAGRFGSLWTMIEVTSKQTSIGQIFGITGQCVNAQPTEIINMANFDSTNVGTFDYGQTNRSLEATANSEASGLPVMDTDDSYQGAMRSEMQRPQGGVNNSKTFTLSAPDLDQTDDPKPSPSGLPQTGERIYPITTPSPWTIPVATTNAAALRVVINGKEYYQPRMSVAVVGQTTVITWGDSPAITSNDTVCVVMETLASRNALSETIQRFAPSAGQTSFAISTRNLQSIRFIVDGTVYFPTDVILEANRITWDGPFALGPINDVVIVCETIANVPDHMTIAGPLIPPRRG